MRGNNRMTHVSVGRQSTSPGWGRLGGPEVRLET